MTDLVKLDLRRQKLGMSRAALARRSGISVPAVHRILTGQETSPSVTTIDAIATALGMAIQIVEVVDAEDLRERQAQRKAAAHHKNGARNDGVRVASGGRKEP